MALITDKFGKSSSDTDYAIATTVKTARVAGVTVLEAYDLSRFNPDTPVFFVTYKKTTDPVTGDVSITNTVSWKALVNVGANTLTNLTIAPGYTDIGNDVGDFIECIPTSMWENSLIDGILVEHNQDGTHSNITTTNLTATGTISLPAGSLETADYADGSVGPGALKSTMIQGAQQTAGQQSSTSTETDIAGTSLTFTLSEDATILFMYTSLMTQNNNTRFTYVYINIDGTNDTKSQLQISTATNSVSPPQTCASFTMKTLAAGSHTVKLRTSLSGGSGIVSYSNWYGIIVSQIA